MANTVNYAVKYLEMLDRIYKANSVTSVLESAASQYKLSGENEKTIYLRKMALQGLGSYSRSSGYDPGDATITWEAHTFSQDRSKKFNLDAMDSKEAYTAIAELGAEFERAHVVPEIDAYRFEKICNLCNLDVSEDLTVDNVINAIDTAIQTLDDAEVPQEGRILFVSNTVNTLMKQSGTFFNMRITNNAEPNINRTITKFDDMPLVKVPSARFYNNFDFGTSGAGGFTPNSGAKQLNFMITYAPEIIAVVKHAAPKIIMPQNNQDYDGYQYSYRIYHDLFIPENKVNGVYVHSQA
jgi:hypothetical protein